MSVIRSVPAPGVHNGRVGIRGWRILCWSCGYLGPVVSLRSTYRHKVAHRARCSA